MAIYVLKAYPDAHKWQPKSWIIGYFTNKRALLKAIRQHADELQIYDEKAFYRALARNDYRAVNTYAETGTVELVEANHYDADLWR